MTVVVDVLNDSLDWWMFGATMAAAAATAVSAGIIARQAVHTRDAVRLARQSMFLTERAQLDASTPRTFVSVKHAYLQDVVERTQTTPPQWEVRDGNYRFILPRDAEKVLRWKFQFLVRNDGPGSARLDVTGDAGDGEHQVKNLTLPAGGEQLLNGFMSATVGEWAQDAEMPAGSVKTQLEISYSGPGDSDVDVIHAITLEGSLLMPTPEHGSTYQLNVGAKDMIVEPSRRVYWRSRAAEQELGKENPPR